MTKFTIVFSVLLLFCTLLTFLSFRGKLVWKPAYGVFFMAGLLCVAGIGLCSAKGGTTVSRLEKSEFRENVYTSLRLLENGRYGDAVSAAAEALLEKPGDSDAVFLKGAALNAAGSFSLSDEALASGKDDRYPEILKCNAKEKKLSDDQIREIAGSVLKNLAISSEEQNRWDRILRIRYELGQSQDTEAPDSVDEGLKLYAYRRSKRNVDALSEAEKLAKEGSLRHQIMLASFYADGYAPHDYSRSDEEIDTLLSRAASIEIELNRLEESEDTGISNAYRLKKTEYEMALKELDQVPGKRALNYFSSITPPENGKLAYHFEMARLCFFAGDEEKAAAELDNVFNRKTVDPGEWLGTESLLVRDAFLAFLNSGNVEDFYSAYGSMCAALESNMYGASYGKDNFADFLITYLRNLYTAIRINRIDVRNYPAVKAILSFARDEELTKDMLKVTDGGHNITDFSLEKMETDASLAISVVLDNSGSMAGEKMTTAKRAASDFVTNLDNDVLVSLNVFSSSAYEAVPLTKEHVGVKTALSNLVTMGGTNIASGIMSATQSLSTVDGEKIIILLSDGMDDPYSKIEEALDQARAQNITIYTIGMQGADEAYLNRISSATGGTYASVTSDRDLHSIYNLIRMSVGNRYLLKYTLTGESTIPVKNEYAEDTGTTVIRKVRTDLVREAGFDEKTYYIGFQQNAESTDNYYYYADHFKQYRRKITKEN